MNININLNANVQQNGFGLSVNTDNKKVDVNRDNKSFSMADKAYDPIAERRARAFEKARKIVSDAFAGEQKIDKEMQELRDLSTRIVKENKEMLDQISQNKTEMADLQEVYGVSEDSQEQKDLKILMKKNDAYYDPSVRLTEEEQLRYNEILKDGKTEYQSRVMERYEENNRLHSEMQENLALIHANGSALRFIKGERLKSNPIGEAEDAAKQVMEAENEAITGEIVGNALDHMQEKLEEKVEEVKKQEQQKAEREEQMEAVQEKVEEQRHQIEEVREETGLQTSRIEPDDIVQIQEQIQAEIDKVLEELKLLTEDLKGRAVDKLV